MIKKNLKKTPLFSCDPCGFITNNKKDFNRHIITAKHASLTSSEQKNPEKEFGCEMCKKIYKSRVGLWYHNKICIKQDKPNIENKNDTLEKDSVKELIKLNRCAELLHYIPFLFHFSNN